MFEFGHMNRGGYAETGFCLRTTALCAAVAMFLAEPVFALSDLEIREKRSAEINAIKKTVCAGEAPDVLKLIEYSTALVFHNELEEARTYLNSAMAQARSQSCKEELSKTIGGL